MESNESKFQRRLREVLKMKERLMSNANLRNLVYENLDQQQKLVEGLRKVEISKMIEQAQHLDKVMIPGVIRKYGEKSPEFEFWKGVLDTILWAMYLVDYTDMMNRKLIRTQHILAHTQNQNIELEQELQYFTTLERFITTQMLVTSVKNEVDQNTEIQKK